MTKSLCVSFMAIVVLMWALSSKAEVKCAQCGKMVRSAACKRIEATEVKFRNLYLNQLMDHIRKTHSQFIIENGSNDLDNNKFYEYYHNPFQDDLFSNNNLGQKAAMMSIKIESELQSKKLSQSIGDFLPYDEIRPKIKNAQSGLELIKHDFARYQLSLEIFPQDWVCNNCFKGTLPYNDRNYRRPVTPKNIQLAMKFDQILDDSDIIIMLHGIDSVSPADFLIDYFKLYSSKRVVVGLDTFNDEVDSSRPEFEVVKKMLETEFNKCDDDDMEHDYRNLSSIITGFGLPVLASEKYSSRHWNQFDNHIMDLLLFTEKRCKHAACFGIRTPFDDPTFLKKNFESIVKQYYELIKQAYLELNETPPTFDEALTTKKQKVIQTLLYSFAGTKLCRQEIARKVCDYFNALNVGTKSHNKIPLIITMNTNYGLSSNQSNINNKFQDKLGVNQKAKWIPELVRQRLKELKLGDKKVTVIYASLDHGVSRIFSRQENMFLADLDLDYVMFFN